MIVIVPYIDPKDDIPMDIIVLANIRISLLILVLIAIGIEIASCLCMFKVGIVVGPFIPMLSLVTTKQMVVEKLRIDFH